MMSNMSQSCSSLKTFLLKPNEMEYLLRSLFIGLIFLSHQSSHLATASAILNPAPEMSDNTLINCDDICARSNNIAFFLCKCGGGGTSGTFDSSASRRMSQSLSDTSWGKPLRQQRFKLAAQSAGGFLNGGDEDEFENEIAILKLLDDIYAAGDIGAGKQRSKHQVAKRLGDFDYGLSLPWQYNKQKGAAGDDQAKKVFRYGRR